MHKDNGTHGSNGWPIIRAAATVIAAFIGVGAADAPPNLSTQVDNVVREPWPDGQAPTGTGFLVSNKGLVFTASHVVTGCKAIYVAQRAEPDHAVAAVLIGTDSRSDAALLSAPKLTGKALRFSDQIPEADTDLLIAGAQMATSQLHATALGMSAEGNLGRIFHYRAQLVAGVSGAPILNRQGLVVAVVVGKIENRPGIGIGMTEQDLRGFLRYFGAPPPVHSRQGVVALIDDWTDNAPVGSDIDGAVVRVSCR